MTGRWWPVRILRVTGRWPWPASGRRRRSPGAGAQQLGDRDPAGRERSGSGSNPAGRAATRDRDPARIGKLMAPAMQCADRRLPVAHRHRAGRASDRQPPGPSCTSAMTLSWRALDSRPGAAGGGGRPSPPTPTAASGRAPGWSLWPFAARQARGTPGRLREPAVDELSVVDPAVPAAGRLVTELRGRRSRVLLARRFK